jgi:hypothetical protein
MNIALRIFEFQWMIHIVNFLNISLKCIRLRFVYIKKGEKIKLKNFSVARNEDLKVCDDGTLVPILCFWTIFIILPLSKNSILSCLFFRMQRFGDWIPSPSSGKIY